MTFIAVDARGDGTALECVGRGDRRAGDFG